jgi:hypothetical protein
LDVYVQNPELFSFVAAVRTGELLIRLPVLHSRKVKPANDAKPIARTARAALTKSSPVRTWLYYFEKCSKIQIPKFF